MEFGVAISNGQQSSLPWRVSGAPDDLHRPGGRSFLISGLNSRGQTLLVIRRPIMAGRHSEGALECAAEVADADIQKRREILDVDLRAKIGVDVRCKATRLQGRKSPASH